MSKRLPAPLIGITCEAVSKRKDFANYDLLCDHRYAAAVMEAGGHPVLLPIDHRESLRNRYLEGIDGLVIVGGDDLDPTWYGERPKKRTKIAFQKRSKFEAWLYEAGKGGNCRFLASAMACSSSMCWRAVRFINISIRPSGGIMSIMKERKTAFTRSRSFKAPGWPPF